MLQKITNHVAKGLINLDDTSVKFTWFRTNFNMPVPDVWGGTSWNRDDGAFTYIGESLSYDLSGFTPGYEICVGVSIWDFENNEGSTWNINTWLYQDWKYTDDATIIGVGLISYNFIVSLPPGYYAYYGYSQNIGCAPWEVDVDGTYHFRANAVGTPNITLVNTEVVISNVPDTTQLNASTVGYIWVEGNDLCYVDAFQWKHTIVGIDQGNKNADAGYIWLDSTSYYINWIGSNGHQYIIPWFKKQFASTFSDGATGTVYAGTIKKGFLWADEEFGMTHLAYIAPDGYKYLFGGGNDPYN